MKRRVKKKLNIIGIIFLWAIPVLYVNIFPPANIYLFTGFYLLLFLALLNSLKIFFIFKRGLLWTMFVIVFLFLRQMNLDNIINLILLIGLLITLDFYLKNS